MAFALITTPGSGDLIATSPWGLQVKENFDQAPNLTATILGDLPVALAAGVFTRFGTGVGVLHGSGGGLAYGPVTPSDVAAGATWPVSVTGQAGGGAPPTGAAAGALTGAYPSPGIGAGRVGAAQIAAGAVGAGHVAANAVGTVQLADGAATGVKLARLTLGQLPALPAVAVYKTNNQSLNPSGSVVVAFTSELHDVDDLWTAAQPTRLTCRTAGIYQIVGTVALDPSLFAATVVRLELVQNGSVVIAASTVNGPGGAFTYAQVSGLRRFNPPEYVELRAVHASGAQALVIRGVTPGPVTIPQLSMAWVSKG